MQGKSNHWRACLCLVGAIFIKELKKNVTFKIMKNKKGFKLAIKLPSTVYEALALDNEKWWHIDL